MKPLLLSLVLGLVATEALAQGTLQATVGPAVFTNSTQLGYADGQRAGNDFYCGLYASPAQEVTLLAGAPVPFTNGMATFSLMPVMTVPSGSTAFVQFKAWPAPFASYEEALATGSPSVVVGMSGIFTVILGGTGTPPNPPAPDLRTGPIWLSPVPEPSGLVLLGAAALLVAAGFRPPCATRPVGCSDR